MEKGELVPDEVVIAIAKEKLASTGDKGFILDGFPRTIAQAQALDVALADLQKPLEAVVNLKVDEEELIRRLSGRRVCPSCGEPYHVDSKPPKVDGKCDNCGADWCTERMISRMLSGTGLGFTPSRRPPCWAIMTARAS